MEKKFKVALYARFSTSMQREESITAQVRAMQEYCNKKDWEVVQIYQDKGISGKTDKRPEFQQMIEDSKKKLFDIVLVHKLDRFCRNRYDSAIYKSKLQKNGVRLCSASENIDDSPESILLEALLEGIAEYYSANLAKESLKGLKENAYQCKHTGGSAPLGYDIDKDKHMIINERETKSVRLIFSMYLEGYSLQNIADFLNSEGYLTKKKKSFTKFSFDSILRNEKYIGVYFYNKSESKRADGKRNSKRHKSSEEIIRIEGGCPVIISKDVFEQVQAKLKSNKAKGGRYVAKNTYLCSGKIICGCCGRNIVGVSRSGKFEYPKYTCPSKKSECDNRRELPRDTIDSFLLKLLEKKIFSQPDNEKIQEDVDKLRTLSQNEPAYRTIIQKYLHCVTVHKKTVAFEIFENFGEVKRYYYPKERFRKRKK